MTNEALNGEQEHGEPQCKAKHFALYAGKKQERDKGLNHLWVVEYQ